MNNSLGFIKVVTSYCREFILSFIELVTSYCREFILAKLH